MVTLTVGLKECMSRAAGGWNRNDQDLKWNATIIWVKRLGYSYLRKFGF